MLSRVEGWLIQDIGRVTLVSLPPVARFPVLESRRVVSRLETRCHGGSLAVPDRSWQGSGRGSGMLIGSEEGRKGFGRRLGRDADGRTGEWHCVRSARGGVGVGLESWERRAGADWGF